MLVGLSSVIIIIVPANQVFEPIPSEFFQI